MNQEEMNQNSEIIEEFDYQEYGGNRFLVYNGVLKDVELGCETVLLPENVREIRRQAFLNVRLQNRMETLVLPASIKKIDRLTFAGMESLQYVEFHPESEIKILEPGLFRNCTRLVKVALPASLRKIDSRAFENCIRLKEVELAAKYVIVKEDAFFGCPCLKHKQLAEAAEKDRERRKEEEERAREAKYELFRDLGKRKEEQKNRQKLTEQEDKEKAAGVLPKPAETGGKPVAPKEKQKERAGAGGENQTELISAKQSNETINANTEFCIKEGILERCEIGSSHIVLPEGIKVIASEAFSGSLRKELLECLELPEGVESIGDRACYGLENLKEIRLPSSISYIGRKAFEGTAWLAMQRKQSSCVIVNGILISAYYDSMVLEARLPENIWRIASYAFYLSEVYRVKLPDSVREIDSDAFYNAGVTEIEFPNQENLLLHAPVIRGCSRLKEMIIPEKIERIEEGLVEGCPVLQRVCLKNSQTAVSRQAFAETVRIWVL